MSQAFRDTFTRDEEHSGLHGHDDAAFIYFAGSILACVALPLTVSLLHAIFEARVNDEDTLGKRDTVDVCRSNDAIHKADGAPQHRRLRNFPWLQLAGLGSVFLLLRLLVAQLGEETEIWDFDPYRILQVSPDTELRNIKRAYRKIALGLHLERPYLIPWAVRDYILAAKAYSTLTDETAWTNYAKFRNPDGPWTMKVGIGLPLVLLEEENHFVVLSMFFFILFVVIPTVAICCANSLANEHFHAREGDAKGEEEEAADEKEEKWQILWPSAASAEAEADRAEKETDEAEDEKETEEGDDEEEMEKEKDEAEQEEDEEEEEWKWQMAWPCVTTAEEEGKEQKQK